MKSKHVPDLELCQEFDRLCKEKKIVMPATEYQWEKRMGEWSIVKSREPGVQYIDTADLKLYLPAPLVSELGEWLPSDITQPETLETCFFLKVEKTGYGKFVKWYVRYINSTVPSPVSNSEANARQMMVNHLIAERIITKL